MFSYRNPLKTIGDPPRRGYDGSYSVSTIVEFFNDIVAELLR